MRKFRLLKYIEEKEDSIPIWTTFDTDWDKVVFDWWWDINVNFLIKEWYIEEIFELKEILPKFKVWDYVVWNKKTGFSWDIYIEIHSIHNIDNEFAYNFEKFRENDLRLPTEEELKKYFR